MASTLPRLDTCQHEDSDQSASEVTEDCRDEESPGSYDSDEFARHRFSLTAEELKKCLWLLQSSKRNDIFHTCTSKWNKSSRIASAAYKLFRVKRWLLMDENLIFDPLYKNKNYLRIDPNQLLWTDAVSTDVSVPVKLESVDEIIATHLGTMGTAIIENLKKFDNLLQNIDGALSVEMQSGRFISEMLAKSAATLPETIDIKARTFLLALLPAMLKMERDEKLFEITFLNIFTRLFSCVVACLREEKTIDCASNIDGFFLDKFVLPIDGSNLLEIASRPDLFIYERNDQGGLPRTIAVVEAKGKYHDSVIHSDEEDEPVKELEEESEEELPFVEKIINTKHKKLKKIQPKMRRFVRKFLPQLIGEMICCNENHESNNIFPQNPGYSLGVAVIGFEVYFVSLLTSDSRDYPRHMFFNPYGYSNVFVTKPLDIRRKKHRRRIIKVLAAACLIKRSNFFVSYSDFSKDILGLDLHGLDLHGKNVLCLDLAALNFNALKIC